MKVRTGDGAGQQAAENTYHFQYWRRSEELFISGSKKQQQFCPEMHMNFVGGVMKQVR